MSLGAADEQRRDAAHERVAGADRADSRVVILSTVLLTDRILLYSRCLEVLRSHGISTTVFTTSSGREAPGNEWQATGARVEPFFEVGAYPTFPHLLCRRFNDALWDIQVPSPSRTSVVRLGLKGQSLPVRVARTAARLAAGVVSGPRIEPWVERLLLTSSRSPQARGFLERSSPTMVLAMGPHRYNDSAVIGEARRLGVPVVAFITSWDNLSTKARMEFTFDAFLVWSPDMKEELHHYYPYSRETPVAVVGPPQFDVFHDDRFSMTREAWCAQHGLNPDHPVILYGLGSPNLSPGERYAVRHLAEAIAQGRLGDAQLLVRPHPLFDDGRLQDEMRSFSPRVIVQKTGDPELAVAARFQSALQIRDWVSTFRHAAVVVNFSSTVVIDAALSDRPVVNLDFDPEPGQPNQQLYRAVNHVWSHFRPLAESGGMWLVNSLDDMTAAVRSYLAHPELHRDQRLAMARRVCGYLDGRCGERMGDTISELVHRWRRSPPAVTGAAPR